MMIPSSPAPTPRNACEQPWFVLNSSHYCVMNTRHPAIAHYYAFDVAPSAERTFAVPDGCVDIIFDCDTDHPAARVCGTPLEARRVELLHRHRYFGLRFRPGVVPGLLHNLAEELTEQEINLLDIVPGAQSLIDTIAASPGFDEQMSCFNAFAAQRLGETSAGLTSQVVRTIIAHRGDIRVSQLEDLSGYSGRTLQRQFRQDTGMTPKTFCRIIRCQAALNSITTQAQVSFSELAMELGFTDQSHFLRDFKKLVSTTPNDYHRRVSQDGWNERIRVMDLH